MFALTANDVKHEHAMVVGIAAICAIKSGKQMCTMLTNPQLESAAANVISAEHFP